MMRNCGTGFVTSSEEFLLGNLAFDLDIADPFSQRISSRGHPRFESSPFPRL